MRFQRFYTLFIALLTCSIVKSDPICRHFYTGKWRMSDVIVTTFTSVDFGVHTKDIEKFRDQSVIRTLSPETQDYWFHEELGNPPPLELAQMGVATRIMPGAPDNISHYFSAQSSIPDHFLAQMALLKNPKTMERYRKGIPIFVGKRNLKEIPEKDAVTNNDMIELYQDQDSVFIQQLTSFDLTWRIYSREKTVSSYEIQDLRRIEESIDPRRKVTFELSVPVVRNGFLIKKVLGIMRVHDGSPHPTMSFSHHPTHSEAPISDPRSPIERRYPEIDFRKDDDTPTEYIFEPGRLAKAEDIEGFSMIEYQFHKMGEYLARKFGFKGLAPDEYRNGKVLAETTGRNLEKFMAPRSEGGFAYTLDYIVEVIRDEKGKPILGIDGKPKRKITKVPPGTTYEQLEHKFEETDTKFLMHQRVETYIRNFNKLRDPVPRKSK